MVFRDDLILFQVLELFVCCVKFGLEVFKLFIPFVGKGNKFCIKLFGISNLFLRLLIFVKKYFQSLLFLFVLFEVSCVSFFNSSFTCVIMKFAK